MLISVSGSPSCRSITPSQTIVWADPESRRVGMSVTLTLACTIGFGVLLPWCSQPKLQSICSSCFDSLPLCCSPSGSGTHSLRSASHLGHCWATCPAPPYLKHIMPHLVGNFPILGAFWQLLGLLATPVNLGCLPLGVTFSVAEKDAASSRACSMS